MIPILKPKIRFQYRRRGPKPFCYRLKVTGIGDIGDSTDWQLLVMIAESLYPDQFFTGFPVYSQPPPYSELLKLLNLLFKD